MASTPATKVVATAPIPGIITPSLPLAGSMVPVAAFVAYRFAPAFFTATRPGRQLHLAAGAFRMRQRRLAMLMFTRRGRISELLAMASPVGIPPIGHEHSRFLLIHDLSPMTVTVASHRHQLRSSHGSVGVWQTNPGRMHEIALQRRWMFIERGRTCYMTLSEWRLHQLQCCREGCSGGRMVHCKYIQAGLAVSALMLYVQPPLKRA